MSKIEKYYNMEYLLRGTIYDRIAYRSLDQEICLCAWFYCPLYDAYAASVYMMEAGILMPYTIRREWEYHQHPRDIMMIRDIIPPPRSHSEYELVEPATQRLKKMEGWRFRRDSNPQHSP